MPSDDRRDTVGPGEAWLADFACCLRFFSRLTVPALGSADDPQAPPSLARAVRALPLAGAALALPAALLLLVLGATALPGPLIAVLALAALAMTTGALHEDGLADVVDGFFGGATPARRLEIMADSRTGAFGALALCLTQIALIIALAAIIDRHGTGTAALVLVCGAAVSRAMALWPWVALPPARPGGLAARSGQPDIGTARHATGVAVLVNVLVALALGFSAWLITLAAAGIGALAVGILARSRIAGHTGDVIGAAQQMAWLAFLTGLLMLH